MFFLEWTPFPCVFGVRLWASFHGVGAASVRVLNTFRAAFNYLLVLMIEFVACFCGTCSRRIRKNKATEKQLNLQTYLFAGFTQSSLPRLSALGSSRIHVQWTRHRFNISSKLMKWEGVCAIGVYIANIIVQVWRTVEVVQARQPHFTLIWLLWTGPVLHRARYSSTQLTPRS